MYSDIVGPKQLAPLMDQPIPHRVLYNALGRPYFSLRVQRNPLVLLRGYCNLLRGWGEKEKPPGNRLYNK